MLGGDRQLAQRAATAREGAVKEPSVRENMVAYKVPQVVGSGWGQWRMRTILRLQALLDPSKNGRCSASRPGGAA